jgi:hypothetical protein
MIYSVMHTHTHMNALSLTHTRLVLYMNLRGLRRLILDQSLLLSLMEGSCDYFERFESFFNYFLSKVYTLVDLYSMTPLLL